ncbi:hypothetical protein pb186bvf_019841 [Paramecium bursaria]
MQIFLIDQPHSRISIDLFINIREEQSNNAQFLNELNQFIYNIEIESEGISQYDLQDNYEIYKENKQGLDIQSLSDMDQQNKQQYKQKVLKYKNLYIYELMDSNKRERQQIRQLIKDYKYQTPNMISFMPILFGYGITQMPNFQDLQSLQQIKVNDQELINLSTQILEQLCQSMNKYLKLIKKDIFITTHMGFYENLNYIYLFQQENKHEANIYGYCVINNNRIIKLLQTQMEYIRHIALENILKQFISNGIIQ